MQLVKIHGRHCGGLSLHHAFTSFHSCACQPSPTTLSFRLHRFHKVVQCGHRKVDRSLHVKAQVCLLACMQPASPLHNTAAVSAAAVGTAAVVSQAHLSCSAAHVIHIYYFDLPAAPVLLNDPGVLAAGVLLSHHQHAAASKQPAPDRLTTCPRVTIKSTSKGERRLTT